MITRNTVYIAADEWGNATHLEIVQYRIKCDRYPSITQLKNALREIRDYISDYVYIEKTYSAYDCTGATSTSYLDRIERRTDSDFEGVVVTYILTHRTSQDV